MSTQSPSRQSRRKPSTSSTMIWLRHSMKPHFTRFARLSGLLGLLCIGCGEPTALVNMPPRNGMVACFGDSLVAGVGASSPDASYPSLLSHYLGQPVANLGRSGDTTGAGVARLAEFADSEFGVVIVTLGGNDILRRVHWDETVANLEHIFSFWQQNGAVVVFTGVIGPLNPTRDKHYAKLCEAAGVLYIADILDDILGNPPLMADEIHPNDKGYDLVAKRVAAALTNAGLDQAAHE